MWGWLLLGLLVVSCAGPTRRGVATDVRGDGLTDQVRGEIERATAELERRMRANDLAGVAALYADDAVLLSPSGRTTAGREAIDAYWQGFGEGIDWDLSILSLEGSDDLVVHRGVSTLTYAREGEARTSVVDFWLTWRRDAVGWRVAVDAYW